MKPSALAAAFDAVRRMFPVGRTRLAVDGSAVALVDAPPAPAAMKVFDGAVDAAAAEHLLGDVTALFAAADGAEGIQSFVERRKANFIGR
ncbi:hypothetical protein [Nocardia brasiliensis]|uniref:hypothetical protein n=1 Tax=Nocardia brasiliensis TaxID=37326 RepID=UPI0024569E33|nr:hypothetical protein [Nocardia brasiliensis]